MNFSPHSARCELAALSLFRTKDNPRRHRFHAGMRCGPEEDPGEPEVTMDADRFILTMKGNDPIVESSIKKFMDETGRGCYRLTYDSLFRACGDTAEVKVEGRRIAVRESSIAALEKRLKRYGYVM